jgi:hypothetical protein
MTNKGQAKEILTQFNDATIAYDSGDHTAKGINDSIMAMVNQNKRCAIIAVDLLIKENTFNYEAKCSFERKKYWESIKQEIEFL